jgi:hypothetical protein
MRITALTPVFALAAACSLVEPLGDYPGTAPSDASTSDATVDATSDVPLDTSGWPCGGDSECNDNNPCTNDSCQAGKCRQIVVAGASCANADKCDGDETCSASGACEPGAPPPLDDQDDCTIDGCTPATGVSHVQQTELPPQCLVGGSDQCPSGFYRKGYLCELPSCPATGFGVNAVVCAPSCAPQIEVCCTANDCSSTSCPTGYQLAGSVNNNCWCGVSHDAFSCVKQ